MATINLDEDPIKGLRQYLAFHVDMRNQRPSMKDPSWVYVGMEGFVLDEGQPFTEFSPFQPRYGQKNRYRPRVPKGCFNNAYMAAVASRGALRYVEGYAYSSFMPVHHAWNLDKDGLVVDTTWCGDGGLRRPKPGIAYYGVEFPLGYVRKTRTEQNCSIIDQWERNWPLLTTPLKEVL